MEKDNIAEKQTKIVAKLQKMLADWRMNINAQMPEKNPDYIEQ